MRQVFKGYSRQRAFIVGLLAVYFLGTGMLVAQVGKQMDGQDDGAFLRRASATLIWRIEAGRIAGAQGSAKAVRDFGSHIAASYGEVEAKLASLAEQKNVTITRRLDETYLNTLRYMSNQKGAELDREYMVMTADDLSADERQYRQAILYTRDPDVSAFAAQTLKKLEEDRRWADRIIGNLPLPVLK